MPNRFHKHYSLEEARALLPEVRKWLKQLGQSRRALTKYDQQLGEMLKPGCDVGGELVNSWVRNLADLRDVLLEFYRREIQIKDLERGLIDFPALMEGREVFLCWEKSEDDIEFWHELDAGYAGRERLSGLD